MPQASPKARKFTTGVSLDVDVMHFLDQVALTEDRDRSKMINRIVREWAQSKGTPIPVKQAKETRRVRASQ
jgi:hypothetical protein